MPWTAGLPGAETEAGCDWNVRLAVRHQAGPGGGDDEIYTRESHTWGTERREYRLDPNLAAAPRVFYGPICNSMAARTVRVPRFSTLCARPPTGPLSENGPPHFPWCQLSKLDQFVRRSTGGNICRYTVNGVLCVGGVQTAGACGCRIGLPCQLLSGTELKIDKPAIGKRRPIPQSRRE